jgi:LmbE family N-acetylglucosaminyl deacetylase
MKTLLVILAHPDDESFGPGGTLAKYAHEGVSVHYLCGTRGESGTVDAEKLNGYKNVAELRTSELMCASKELQLASVRFLGYRDSGMSGSADNQLPGTLYAAPLDEVANRIVSHIDELNPDVILTHDQFGGYGHPDHIKLHLATLRAYEMKFGVTIDVSNWTGNTQSPNVKITSEIHSLDHLPRLYFTSLPKQLVKLGVKLMPLLGQNPRAFGRNKDIDLVRIASWDVPTTTIIDTRSAIEIKKRASACHASQQSPGQQSNLLIRFIFRRNQGREYFSRVFPPAFVSKIDNDLFI